MPKRNQGMEQRWTPLTVARGSLLARCSTEELVVNIGGTSCGYRRHQDHSRSRSRCTLVHSSPGKMIR